MSRVLTGARRVLRPLRRVVALSGSPEAHPGLVRLTAEDRRDLTTRYDRVPAAAGAEPARRGERSD